MLITAKALGTSLKTLLLNICSTPIGPHIPSSQAILHNRTQEFQGQPSRAVDFEEVHNYTNWITF